MEVTYAKIKPCVASSDVHFLSIAVTSLGISDVSIKDYEGEQRMENVMQ
jgi:hypothetical protein